MDHESNQFFMLLNLCVDYVVLVTFIILLLFID